MAGLCHIANDILVFFCGGNNGQNRLVSFDGMAAADSRADNQLSEGDAGQRADGADLLCAAGGQTCADQCKKRYRLREECTLVAQL